MGIGLGFSIVPSPRAKLIGRATVFALACLLAFAVPLGFFPRTHAMSGALWGLTVTFWGFVGTAFVCRSPRSMKLLLGSENVRTRSFERLPVRALLLHTIMMIGCNLAAPECSWPGFFGPAISVFFAVGFGGLIWRVILTLEEAWF